MRKLILSIIVFSILNFASELKAQCTPDTSIHSTGVYPSVLDTAEIDVQYNQVIQFYINKDTTVVFSGNTLNATIDSLTVTGVKGMPAGFTYQCNNGSCTVSGGTTGCVTLKGKAVHLQGGTYPLTVYLTIYAKVMLGPIPVGQTVYDSTSKYQIVVRTPAGVAELNKTREVFIYPNPAKDNLQVYILNSSANFKYQIFNISGALVQKGETNGFEPIKEIALNPLNKGIYLLQLNDNGRQYLKKFVVGE